MHESSVLTNSTYWTSFVKFTFGVALLGMAAYVFFMDGTLLMKGYLALNSLFLVSSTIMLSKTLRDEHEAKRLSNNAENRIIQQNLKGSA